MICEDMWFPNIAANLKSQGAQILIVLNGSPFEIDKQQIRLAQTETEPPKPPPLALYQPDRRARWSSIWRNIFFCIKRNGETLLSCKPLKTI